MTEKTFLIDTLFGFISSNFEQKEASIVNIFNKEYFLLGRWLLESEAEIYILSILTLYWYLSYHAWAFYYYVHNKAVWL